MYHRDSAEWETVQASLDKIENLSDERNFRVLFAVFPLVPGKNTIPEPRMAHEYLQVKEELGRRGFLVVDLFGPFNAAGFNRIRYWPGDPYHYNPAG